MIGISQLLCSLVLLDHELVILGSFTVLAQSRLFSFSKRNNASERVCWAEMMHSMPRNDLEPTNADDPNRAWK
jgi:hypothetical protein